MDSINSKERNSIPVNDSCHCKKRHNDSVRSTVFVAATISYDDDVFAINIGDKGRMVFRESN